MHKCVYVMSVGGILEWVAQVQLQTHPNGLIVAVAVVEFPVSVTGQSDTPCAGTRISALQTLSHALTHIINNT